MAVPELFCGPTTGPRYRLVKHLATGGQSEVYKGEMLSRYTGEQSPSSASGASVAVKVFRLRSDVSPAEQLKMWEDGDGVLAELNERGVSSVPRRVDGFLALPPGLSAGEVPQVEAAARVPYQVTEFVAGQTLPAYLRAGKVLDGVAALRQIAGALGNLHTSSEGQCAVHGDVTTSNVLVSGEDRVTLIDFTLARFVDGVDHPDMRRDIVGFCAIAYALVTGEDLYGGTVTPLLPEADRALSPERKGFVLADDPSVRRYLDEGLAAATEGALTASDLDAWIDGLASLMARVNSGQWIVRWEPPTSSTLALEQGNILRDAEDLSLVSESERTSAIHAALPARRGRALIAIGAGWCVLAWLSWLLVEMWRTHAIVSSLRTGFLVFAVTAGTAIVLHLVSRLAIFVVAQSFDYKVRKFPAIPRLVISLFLFGSGFAFLLQTPLNPVRLVSIIAEAVIS